MTPTRGAAPPPPADRRHDHRRHSAGSTAMKLGFLTAPFPETPLMEVADWAAASGFEVLEIACWPRTSGPTRRYAGTSHIDVANLSDGQATEIVDEIAAKGLSISGLGFYPNPLHPDPAHREQVIGHLKAVMVAAAQDGDPARQHVHGRRRVEEPGPELGGGPPRLAGHRGLRAGPGREDHARELPDALLLRRVAGRPQHRDDAAHVAPDPGAVGRHDRAQLRPVAPRAADDRHGPLPARSSGRTSSTTRRRT